MTLNVLGKPSTTDSLFISIYVSNSLFNFLFMCMCVLHVSGVYIHMGVRG